MQKNYSKLFLAIIFLLFACEKKFFLKNLDEPVAIEKQQAQPITISSSLHPKHPRGWDTHVLIMDHKEEIKVTIDSCNEKLTSINLFDIDKNDIDQQVNHFVKIIEKSPLDYHWCFYLLHLELDKQIEDQNKTIHDKSLIFQKETSRLFFLAKGLDAFGKNNQTTYVDYLRERYISLSKNVFGRRLDFIK